MYICILAICIFASLILIKSYIEIARLYDVTAKMNHRTNHVGEIPKGAGIVILSIALLSWFICCSVIDIKMSKESLYLLGAAFFIVIVFFIEDVFEIWRIIRIVTQIISAALMTTLMGDKIIVFETLPYLGNFIIVVIGWVWFMNMYNFMDGIDGMTSSNTLFFLLSIIIISSIAGYKNDLSNNILIVSLIGALIPFLFINWHPSKVLIGDSGSIGLGFIVGYFMLDLSSKVGVTIPSIICSYYLFDTGITLLKRIIKKENILNPHSSHFFQIAIKKGMNHADICKLIFKFNIISVSLGIFHTLHRVAYVQLFIILLCICSSILLLFILSSEARYRKRS